MDGINKTLYIPLYGKAYVSRRGIILRDPKAEKIWSAESFPLKSKSRSKWLAFYMGMRSAVFDRWTLRQMRSSPDALILHIGCGMDSRCERVDSQGHLWYDIDFPEVIRERQRHYQQTGAYQMVAADIRDPEALSSLPGGTAIVVMEGVSMYLTPEELEQVLSGICAHFDKVNLLMDCYTTFAARASRFKNPINDVGVTQVYGLDDPKIPEHSGLTFIQEHSMTPDDLIDQLAGAEKKIFKTLYAGKIAEKMYRLYEYRK